MDAFRLVHTRYAEDVSGLGAYKAGGRWNPKGYYALYASEYPAAAILEAIVHMPPQIFPDAYSLVCLTISEHADMGQITEKDLPPDWRSVSYNLSVFQNLGKKRLFEAKKLGLMIPSSVAYPSMNFVFNARHPDFSKMVNIREITPYFFDPRLILTMGKGIH